MLMSSLPKSADKISPEEYLEGERAAEIRHEYVDGRVYAMAGASDDHNRVVVNLSAELRERLRGTPCEPFMTDMKVRIPPSFAEVFYYPDAVVVCDPTDNARYYRERPAILFEVISPETERTDRREKAIAYRQIPTLEAYVMLEQNRLEATVLRRTTSGWQSETVQGPEGILRFPTLTLEIPLKRIFERTSAARGLPP